MLDWTDLHHFTALARERTLSSAAKALDVDHVTVARRIASLEAATGLRLVDRRARSYMLTKDGMRIAELASRMEEVAFAIERTVHAANPATRNEISISAPPLITNRLIAPKLILLRRSHPEIHVKLIGERRSAALNRREADLALRLRRPSEPGLIARKIGSIQFGLYGSRSYLQQTPPHAYAFIAYDASMDNAPQQQWLTAISAGREIVLRTSDLENQAIAARTGIGLAVLPRFYGDSDSGLSLHETSEKAVSRDVWLVVHRDLRRVPVVRTTMDFLTECLKAG